MSRGKSLDIFKIKMGSFKLMMARMSGRGVDGEETETKEAISVWENT